MWWQKQEIIGNIKFKFAHSIKSVYVQTTCKKNGQNKTGRERSIILSLKAGMETSEKEYSGIFILTPQQNGFQLVINGLCLYVFDFHNHTRTGS